MGEAGGLFLKGETPLVLTPRGKNYTAIIYVVFFFLGGKMDGCM